MDIIIKLLTPGVLQGWILLITPWSPAGMDIITLLLLQVDNINPWSLVPSHIYTESTVELQKMEGKRKSYRGKCNKGNT